MLVHLLPLLIYGGRTKGDRGRCLKSNVALLRLLAGDRLDPSAEWPHVRLLSTARHPLPDRHSRGWQLLQRICAEFIFEEAPTIGLTEAQAEFIFEEKPSIGLTELQAEFIFEEI